jgi:transcriptional regulator with XRE-family HTH domain
MAARMTGRAFFGRRLRMARERQAPKLSRRELGDRLNVTDSAVAAWECGRNVPEPKTLKRIENILGVNDSELQDIVECLVTGEKAQEYIGRWTHVESRAITLLWFELIIVPGLLQTEEYSWAILRDDERVAVRAARQKVLTKDARRCSWRWSTRASCTATSVGLR